MLRLHNALFCIIVALSSCKDDKITSSEIPTCFATTEKCNGYDDDCDGVIDNINREPCYPGNPDELQNGECSYGKLGCVRGQETCLNWRGPTNETCDGLDNDCDGVIDNGDKVALDLVIALDYSCSMASKIEPIRVGISNFLSEHMSDDKLMVAVIGIPDDVPAHDGEVYVISTLGPPSSIGDTLTRPYTLGGGEEASLDALVMVSDTSNMLSFNWTPLAQRVIVVFTDEPPQSFWAPPVTETWAKDSLRDSGVRAFVVSDDTMWRGFSPLPMGGVFETLEQMRKIYTEGTCH